MVIDEEKRGCEESKSDGAGWDLATGEGRGAFGDEVLSDSERCGLRGRPHLHSQRHDEYNLQCCIFFVSVPSLCT